jgi:hypothetical protein
MTIIANDDGLDCSLVRFASPTQASSGMNSTPALSRAASDQTNNQPDSVAAKGE